MSGVDVKKCSCSGSPAAEFQDKQYGKGMRVFNLDFKKINGTCTVCGTKVKL
jgi:hypothetical protein